MKIHDSLGQDFMHLEGMRVPQAWAWAGGWGLVAIADTGLETNHPELKSFTGPGSVGGTRINGGNFLPALSEDISQIIDGGVQVSPNVDEMRPMVGIIIGVTASVCDELDGIVDGLITPQFAGHGTHVSGLVAANSVDGNGTSGVCKNCGLALGKIALPFCVQEFAGPIVGLNLTELSLTNSVGAALEVGPQVINTSFGRSDFDCSFKPENFACLSLEQPKEMDVIVAAASGNNRTSLQFPAFDPRSKGIGGVDAGLLFWDDSPGSITNCPPAYSGGECGSNYTQNAAEKPPVIERVANIIRVRVRGATQSSPFCLFGINTFLVNIGYLPQGQYRVELYILDDLGFGTFLVRSDNLTVGPAPPTLPVPSFSGVSAFLMIGLLCGMGMWAARRR